MRHNKLLVDTEMLANKAIIKLLKAPVLYLDFETYSNQEPRFKSDKPALDPFRNEISLITLGTDKSVFAFDLMKLSKETIDRIIKLIPDKFIVGHNLKFDLKTLAVKFGVEMLPKECFDTYIAGKLFWNACKFYRAPKGTLSLAGLAQSQLNITLSKEQQASDWSQELTSEQIEYAVNDVNILIPLVKKLVSSLNHPSISLKEDKENLIGCKNYIVNLEMHFLIELIKIELAGIPVNQNYLRLVLKKTIGDHYELDRAFEKLNLNPNSHTQCVKYFNEQGIKLKNTSKDTLQYFKHPIIQKLIRIRQIKNEQNLIKKYLLLNKGRLYTNFNQIKAHSGRMSSYSPNVQQIPNLLKKSFYKAPEGRVILKADYSAIEVRLAAAIARESTMINALRSGQDLHTCTASLLLGKSYNDITDNERKLAKAPNFGLIYGMSATRFQEYARDKYKINWSFQEARMHKAKFFRIYKDIYQWHKITKADLSLADQKRGLMVHTLGGRAVRVNKYTNSLNVPVQGSGADMIKLACVKFSEIVNTRRIDATIVSLIHDEIIVEASATQKDEASDALKDAMEFAADYITDECFKTPVTVEDTSSDSQVVYE